MSTDPVIRDFADALRHSPVASSPGIAALLLRAIARSSELERSSNSASASFFRQLGNELLRLRGNANAKARLDCLFRVCAFLWQYGEPKCAQSIARHAASLAEVTCNLQERRRFHLLLGALYSDLGDPGLALQSYLSSLEVASKLDDGIGVCSAWNNLAALFIDCGLFAEALSCAEHCLRLADRYELTNADIPRRARNNISWANYQLRRSQKCACFGEANRF